MADRRISKRIKGNAMSTCVTPACLYFLQVVNLLFVVHVDPVFGAIPIFLGPICPTSPSSDPLRNLDIHACTVINGSSGCWRETMQVYISGTSSHTFGEMSKTHCIQSLTGTTSIQATEGHLVS